MIGKKIFEVVGLGKFLYGCSILSNVILFNKGKRIGKEELREVKNRFKNYVKRNEIDWLRFE